MRVHSPREVAVCAGTAGSACGGPPGGCLWAQGESTEGPLSPSRARSSLVWILSVRYHTGLVTLGPVPRQRGTDRGGDRQSGPFWRPEPWEKPELSGNSVFPPPPPQRLPPPAGRPPPTLALALALTPASPGPALCPHSHVKGLHLNMAFILNGRILTLFLVRHCPRLFGFTQRDMELMLPFKEKIFYKPLRESGYMHIQSTKPDTVGEPALGTRRPGRGSRPFHPAGRWRGVGGLTRPRSRAPGMHTAREGPELALRLRVSAEVI